MQIAPQNQSDKSPIAALVEAMIAAGCSPELISFAVQTCETIHTNSMEFHGKSMDERLQRIREKDRERKRIKSKFHGIPPDSMDSMEVTISKEELTSKKEEKKESKRERLKQIPVDWKPNEHHHQLCREKGIRTEAVEEVFRESCAATGRLYANHDFAFNTYIRNYNRFNGSHFNSSRKDRRAEEWDEIREELRRSVDEDRARQEGDQPTVRLLPSTAGK